MCAGFSAYFYQEFRINNLISGIFIAIISYIILNKNINGIFFVNLVLIPLILSVLFLIGFKSNGIIGNKINSIQNINWLINSILYASYNTVTLIPIKNHIKNNRDILKISFISMIIILLMAQIIFILLSSINTNINNLELPAVYASRKIRNYI